MASQTHTPGSAPPSCPPSAPSLLLPTFPGAALLVTSSDAPGSKLIIKLKREGLMVGGAEDMPRTQTFFLTGMPLGWATPRRDGPAHPSVRTVLLTKAGEEPASRKPRVPEIVPSAHAPPPSDASFACTSKGVYENYRRWQRYKTLARRHFPATPDAEALACFFIPVLRSLARLRPDMTLEDGVPRAVQEWEHSSNFERMIFYEMAEKFMEFEAEEEQQIQKMKLLASCTQFPAPTTKPTKPPVSLAPESGQQQVYIPKKSASKSRQPRRHQRRPPSTSTPGAPREIPAEAVHQYAEIMEGLDRGWEEEEDEKKEQGECGVPQGQEGGVFPDLSLLQYIDELCDNEEFVCKVEAVIHPQFMADLLSPEKNQDPLNLAEELAEELNLTPNQLIEKRLLALSEEEREPSVCPTPHFDSTPSQSEEEDEVSGNGKGEEAPCQAMKRPIANKGIRTSHSELPTQVLSSCLTPHLHQRPGDFPPKGVRAIGSSFPHEWGSHGSQEGRLLPFLKNTDKGISQNSQGQDQVSNHLEQANGVPPHAHGVRLETIPSKTGKNSLIGNLASQGGSKVGPGIQRPYISEHSKQDDSLEGEAKGQVKVPVAMEQESDALREQCQNGIQFVWKNVDSTQNGHGKLDGVQEGKVKCLKTVQVIWEGSGDDPVESDHASQDINKRLLRDHMAEEIALTLNRPRKHNVDHAEKGIGQSLVQGRKKAEDTSCRSELENKDMTSQWDNQLKHVSQELTQTKSEKQDGLSCDHQREVVTYQNQFQGTCKGPTSIPNATTTQFGSINPCGQSSVRHKSPTLIPAGPGNLFDNQDAKVKSQKKPEVGWGHTKAVPVKTNSPVKSMRLSTDNLALQKQSTSTRLDDQQSTSPPILETDKEVNCPVLKPHIETSSSYGQQLALTHSNGLGEIEGQLPSIDSEHPPFFTCSVLDCPSSRIQKGPGRSQESQWPLTEQGEATPWMGSPSDGKQALKATMHPPGNTVEVDGGSCGPGGNHTPEHTSPGKAVAVLPPQPSFQGGSSSSSSSSHENNEPSQRLESSDPDSSKVSSGTVSSENYTKSQIKGEVGDLLERVTESFVMLPQCPGGIMENSHKCSTKEEAEEEEEDEELSTFSSLLASKLSLSSHSGHVPPPGKQREATPSLTSTGKHGAKTRQSPRVQVLQDCCVPPSKNLDTNPTVHCSHKRKSNSSGTRRSKRLRSQ